MNTAPVLSLVAPNQVDDPKSIEFMIKDLARSGLVPTDMAAYPINSKKYAGAGAYIIPYHDQRMYRTRIDRLVDKYIQPKGTKDVWWGPNAVLETMRDSEVLYIIEGEKKAAAFLKKWPDASVLGIGGCWMTMEKLSDGHVRLLPNIAKAISPGQRVIAIFDGDIQVKQGIQMAATALAGVLKNHSVELELFRPPFEKGVDDWLVADPEAKFSDLVPIPLSVLAESRKQLYAQLGCSVGEKGLHLNELNAAKLLKHYFDGFLTVDKRLGCIFNGEIGEERDLETKAVEYMQGEVSAAYKVPQIRNGLGMILGEETDLVQDMVRTLKWDGVPRLETWGAKYLSNPAWPALAADWGRILMTGLGLRILRPGTKVDTTCILVGAQGIGKSTFFEDLATIDGHSFYYATTTLADTGADTNRTQAAMFVKSLVVDLAEGVIFESNKTKMDRNKQLLTQVADDYRVAYDRHPRHEPRGFVFVGTTNRIDQYSDSSGSRRFITLKVDHITRLPYEEKMQILAEVVAKEDEIRDSAWWVERVKIDEAPNALREGHEHVTNVRELVNTQFARADVIAEFVEGLLDSDEPAVFKATKELFISSNYITARMGEEGHISKSVVARKLSDLVGSVTFPWKLELKRLRIPQLEINQNILLAYTQGINNNQMMLVGYLCTRK